MCTPVTVTTLALGIVIAVLVLFVAAVATWSLWAPIKSDKP